MANIFVERTLSDVDTAWLAAIIDGEGHVRLDTPLKNYRSYRYVRFVVVNTCLPLLERVREICGCGSIFSRKPSGNPAHKQVHVFQVSGENAKVILSQVLPYLIVKQEKTQRILSEADDGS